MPRGISGKHTKYLLTSLDDSIWDPNELRARHREREREREIKKREREKRKSGGGGRDGGSEGDLQKEISIRQRKQSKDECFLFPSVTGQAPGHVITARSP